jgi:hypothetical protein
MSVRAAGAPTPRFAAATRYAAASAKPSRSRRPAQRNGHPEQLGKAVGTDAAREKTTAVSVYGMDGAKKRLLDLVAEALAALADFPGDVVPRRPRPPRGGAEELTRAARLAARLFPALAEDFDGDVSVCGCAPGLSTHPHRHHLRVPQRLRHPLRQRFGRSSCLFRRGNDFAFHQFVVRVSPFLSDWPDGGVDFQRFVERTPGGRRPFARMEPQMQVPGSAEVDPIAAYSVALRFSRRAWSGSSIEGRF